MCYLRREVSAAALLVRAVLRAEHPNPPLPPPSRRYGRFLPYFQLRLIEQGLRFQGRVLHLR